MSLRSVRGLKRANRLILWLKLPPSVIYSCFKDGALQQLKWMLGGNICQQKVYERGTFSVKNVFFRRVGPLGGAFAFKTLLSTSPRKYAFPLTSFCLVPEVFIFCKTEVGIIWWTLRSKL